MPYDIRRLRGLLGALLAVAAGLACLGVVSRATLGRFESWITLRDQTFNVSTSTEKALARVLAIRRDAESGRRPAAGERLGLLIGASTLRQGVEPAILDAEAGGGLRWTNVNTALHIHEISQVTRSIYKAGLKPAVLGLVATPSIVVADVDSEADRAWYDPGTFVDAVKRRDLNKARADLVSLTMVPWRLAFPYRGHVFTHVDRLAYGAKLDLIAALGQGDSAVTAPEADPWANPYPMELDGGSADPNTVGNANILKYIGIKGWYDLDRYRTDGPNFAMLVDLFRRAHNQDTRTFLVYVPESSAFRSRQPAGLAALVSDALKEALGDAAPLIIDFREAMPDSDYTDVNHLTSAGRDKITHKLAETLRPWLARPAKP